MNSDFLRIGADSISMFCRLNVNVKKKLPIRSSEMGLLILIVKSDTPITPVVAANYFGVSKPMIANMVVSLEKQKYLRKVSSMQDKRSYILSAEKKAIELVDGTYGEYLKVIDMLCEAMGEEKYTQFISLIEEANALILKENKNG